MCVECDMLEVMESPSVLIIEDDDGIRELYATALEAANLSVLQAKDGQEGLALALQHHPQVLLVDIMMPKMNGHEAIEKLRLDNWGKHAKVIYLTNMSDPENVVNAVALKPEEYIIKANAEIKDVVNKVRTAMFQ